MAPEQLQGRAVPASDQYALGIVTYEWLSGDRPFQGSFPEIASQHMLTPPASLQLKIYGFPKDIDEVVMRALAKDPQRRFMRVEAFANALEQACQGAPPLVIPSGQPSPVGETTLPGQSPTPNSGVTPQNQFPSGNYGIFPPGQATPNFSGTLPPPPPPPGQPSPGFASMPTYQSQPASSSNVSPGQFSPPPQNGKNQPPNKGISRRLVLVCLVGLLGIVLVGGGLSFLARSFQPQTQNSITGNSTNTTPTSAPANTVTTAPTDTPTVDPNVTPTATPFPTVQITPGTVLYTANWSSGLNGWAGSADWKVLNGVLLNDGTANSGDPQPTIVAPYILEGIVDYAAEVRIRVVRGGPCFDAVTVRGASTTDGWHGYKGVICDGQLKIQANNDVLTQTPFDPQNNWHIYRLEAKGTRLRLYVDGGLSLETNDNRYLTGGQMGLKSADTQLEVSSFKVIAA